MKHVVIIAGPTAVGKTDLSVQLAKHYCTEIISCDSMQIYRQMAIGSAKPSVQEMQGVPHHLMDFVAPTEKYSVSDYAMAARAEISRLHEQSKMPLITGGTGLYVNSLLYKMDFSSAKPDLALRHTLQARIESEGLEALYSELKVLSPEAAKKIHPNNVHKVLRALEIALSGQGHKDFATDPLPETAYTPILVVLTRHREELYERINQRVDIMLQLGLVEEVKALMALGLTSDDQSMKGIGYKEVIGYLVGAYDYNTMVELLKQNTRRYAKRQLTWFRRYNHAIWINLSEIPLAIDQFDAIIKEIEQRQGCSGNLNPPDQQRT